MEEKRSAEPQPNERSEFATVLRASPLDYADEDGRNESADYADLRGLNLSAALRSLRLCVKIFEDISSKISHKGTFTDSLKNLPKLL